MSFYFVHSERKSFKRLITQIKNQMEKMVKKQRGNLGKGSLIGITTSKLPRSVTTDYKKIAQQ